MKKYKALKIIFPVLGCLIVATVACCVWYFYHSDKNDDISLSGGRRVKNSELTCLTVGNDSTTLFLGSKAPRFTVYDTKTDNAQDFPLPSYTDGYNTYDILQTTHDSYLISKRNCGVLHVTYSIDSMSRPTIKSCTRIAIPAAPIPDKHTHYSCYAMIPVDSAVIFGTSNGLLYMKNDKLASSQSDTLAYASFVPQLQHLVSGKRQFAQESMFLQSDTLITVTDHGIYRIAIDNIFFNDGDYQIVDGEMRCYNAAVVSDSIAVLWSPGNHADTRNVTMFSHGGKRGSTRNVPTSTAWMCAYGNTLRCFDKEGDFNCFRAATMLNGVFYYIKDGELCKSDPTAGPVFSNEQIVMTDKGYGLSNQSGIWDIRKEVPKFLGDLEGVSGVRDISVNDKTMYIAVSDGIYAVSLADRLLPYNRKARLVEHNQNRASDRFESVYAAGDTLLIGSRNGLHAYIMSSKEDITYNLKRLNQLMESPYISRITRNDDGSFLLKTLNHGVWTLKSLNDSEAIQSSQLMDKNETGCVNLPTRPFLTWRKLSENLFVIILALFAVIGIFATVVFVIKSKANAKLSSLRNLISEEQNKYHELSEHLETTRQLLIQRKEEMQRLEAEYKTALQAKNDDISISFSSICEKISSCIARLDSDNDFAVYLSGRLSEIKRLTDNHSVDQLHEAADIYREIHGFCENTMSNAYKFAGLKGLSGIWKEPHEEYCSKINGISVPENQSLDSRLDWLVEFSPVREKLFKFVATDISRLISEADGQNCRYQAKMIYKLWNDIILPAKNCDTRLAIARTSLDATTDKSILARTIALTTITFYGCTAPYIDGRPIVNDSGQMIRFEDEPQIGTVYKFWAAQLSKEVFRFGNLSMPSSVADLLWHVFISRQSYSLCIVTNAQGRQFAVTLPMGIRLAYCRMHKLAKPDDIVQVLIDRQKGRPRKV